MGPPCLGSPRRRHRGHARGAHRRHRLLHLLRHSLLSPVHLHAGCARHAPRLPWLPSAPISITILLLGSNDGPSFQSTWTVMLLLYCCFFGLHTASLGFSATAASTSKLLLFMLIRQESEIDIGNFNLI
ncbi:unnamed protein product [Musa hybrid cultivar]